MDFVLRRDFYRNVFDGCCGGINNVVVIIGILRRQVLDVNTAAEMEAAIIRKGGKEFFRFVVGKGSNVSIIFEVDKFVSPLNVFEFSDLANLAFGSARIFSVARLVVINSPANIA